jgi:hypothetical protein
LLQNNGDGTFAAIAPLKRLGLRQFAWVDIDRDGEPDAALIDGADDCMYSRMNDRAASASARLRTAWNRQGDRRRGRR